MVRERRINSTSGNSGNRDRTLECAVCGKIFIRGPLDLHRHMNAITLQHLFASEKSDDYPFGCDHCGIYFTNEANLQSHQLHTTCGQSGGANQVFAESFSLDEEGNKEDELALEDSLLPELENTESSRPGTTVPPSIEQSNYDTPSEDRINNSDISIENPVSNQEGDNVIESESLNKSDNLDAASFAMEVAVPEPSPGEESLTPSQRRADSKTMECMICGKLFPRGPIDLQRHATAVTLKHLVSKKRTSGFTFGCTRCGLHFASQDHLTMHDTCSTCNPEIVWPHYSETMSGLRAIPRAQLEEMPPPPPLLLSPRTPSTPAATRKQLLLTQQQQDSNNPPTSPYPTGKRKESFSSHRHDDYIYTPLAGTGRASRANSHVENATTPLPAQSLLSTPAAAVMDVVGSKRKKKPAITIDYESIKQKRMKFILPDERKAYFAIISLLIDPTTLDPATLITEENYESFIPTVHHPLVEKLKNVLQYTV